MAMVMWDDSLSVGLPEIDDQHKQLLSLTNSLNEAMQAGKGRDILLPMLQSLKHYARVHFDAEERLMDSIGFAAKDPHCEQHDRFIDIVLDFETQLRSGQDVSDNEVMEFLNGWFKKHIQGADKKYASEIR